MSPSKDAHDRHTCICSRLDCAYVALRVDLHLTSRLTALDCPSPIWFLAAQRYVPDCAMPTLDSTNVSPFTDTCGSDCNASSGEPCKEIYGKKERTQT